VKASSRNREAIRFRVQAEILLTAFRRISAVYRAILSDFISDEKALSIFSPLNIHETTEISSKRAGLIQKALTRVTRLPQLPIELFSVLIRHRDCRNKREVNRSPFRYLLQSSLQKSNYESFDLSIEARKAAVLLAT